MSEWRHLIRPAQTGNVAAFGAIVREFQDMAVGYAFSVLRDFGHAEDAAQEAFVQAYRDLSLLREPQAFPAWLRKLVFKYCDRQTRGKRVRTVPLLAGPDIASEEPSPLQAAERNELRQRVLEAINSLPEHERTVVSLFYINGYSQAEVGEFLDVPAKTVKSRLHSARGKLRERMMDMVEETLKKSAPDDGFAKETIQKIVARAKELIGQGELKEAERILREGLKEEPDHPGALRELNRALMWGGVYNEARWELLPEISEHARTILASGEADESVLQEFARTLLAIPAMTEACEFIAEWIAKYGANMARLGMLAWAQGCVGDYTSAEETWSQLLESAASANDEELQGHSSVPCEALVDCLSAADQVEAAQRVVRSAWETFGSLQLPSFHAIWPSLFHRVRFGDESERIARTCWQALRPESGMDSATHITAFCLRAWFDDEATVLSDWLEWVRHNRASKIWRDRCPLAREYRKMGNYDTMGRVARATWDLLKSAPETNSVEPDYECWIGRRFPVSCYIGDGDLETAERVAREAIADGAESSWSWLNDIAIHRGMPSPPELMAELAKKSPDDPALEYGGRYHIAREAGAAGDLETAFSALEQALRTWYNPPLAHAKVWEKDARWGDLREHPEFKRLFSEKRRRIGPIKGSLWYFPGW